MGGQVLPPPALVSWAMLGRPLALQVLASPRGWGQRAGQESGGGEPRSRRLAWRSRAFGIG